MLPTPSPNFADLTNFFRRDGAPTGLLTPPSERKRVRQRDFETRDKKRQKLDSHGDEDAEMKEESDSSESEDDGESGRRQQLHRFSVAGLRSRAMLAGPLSLSQRLPLPTSSILRCFVSSNKADVFKCQSIDENTFITLPYGCAYSHNAKHGGTPHLAVSTEQGTVHILDTSRRRDWDVEPQRLVLQPHENGVFDVKWSPSDTLLATASGDQSVRITTLASSVSSEDRTLHILRGHTGTVKCVAWDPRYDGQVLCGGGRDGSICLWDLRAGEMSQESRAMNPVMTITNAHDDSDKSPKRNAKPRGKRMLAKQDPLKSITHLLYTDCHPSGIVSSGSFDGILKLWDVRLPTSQTPKKSSRSPKKPARVQPLYTTSGDPTTHDGSRRARGITTLAAGSGPTVGLLFALGTDARVQTYALPTLAPLSGSSSSSGSSATAAGGTSGASLLPALGAHEPHHSFYVRLAASPCGRWLASGNVGGRACLYDVATAGSARRAWEIGHAGLEGGVELKGQMGEVGAMDWADGMLATCADDGTVRVWRPDVEVARQCEEDPEDMKWSWSWAARM